MPVLSNVLEPSSEKKTARSAVSLPTRSQSLKRSCPVKPKKGYRKCARCEKNRADRFFTGTRGRICSTCRKTAQRSNSHESRVMQVYGLGSGEYGELLAKQGGKCAICKQTRAKNLDVDHCHKTGLIRGLLCARCNRQLLARGLRDDPWIALSAASYLTDPPAPQLIGRRWYGGKQPTTGR
ncbi:endonuclease domain-containing protein (plasmid) [Streptomyces sp. BI20]|uniref:endonuclease domain-containing protein n=1 Tax=Streptomyces sp. BI20 TaxID=3403460 RepID=UPI003C7731C4